MSSTNLLAQSIQNNPLSFSNIKGKLIEICDEILPKFCDEKIMTQLKTEEKINQICNEIIKEVYLKYNGFKMVCVGYIIQKGNAPFFFDSNCLWDQKTDGIITSKYSTDEYNYFICLFVLSP